MSNHTSVTLGGVLGRFSFVVSQYIWLGAARTMVLHPSSRLQKGHPNYPLVLFAEAIEGFVFPISDDNFLVLKVLMPAAAILNSETFGYVKALGPASAAITASLATRFEIDVNAASGIVTALGVATMGAANLYDETGGTHSPLGLAAISAGFALTVLNSQEKVGAVVASTMIYAGSLVLQDWIRDLASIDINRADLRAFDGRGPLSSSLEFIAFIGAKGFVMISDVTSDFIPEMVLLASVSDTLISPSHRVAFVVSTSVLNSFGRHLKDFYLGGDKSVYSGPSWPLIGAAGVISFFMPWHSENEGHLVKYSYVFYTSLALLDATARLCSVLSSIWFPSDATADSAAGHDAGTGADEVIAADDEVAATPIDAHAGEL